MLDEYFFNLIHGLAGKSRVLDLLGIFLADYLGYLLILTALYLIFSQKDWRIRCQFFLFTVLTIIFSRGLLTELIRYFYHRPRPFLVLDFIPLVNHDAASAFPSGHAAFYFALAAAVFYLLGRSWGWRFIVGALLIGIARVYAGVHWPLDIVGGLLVALSGLFIVKYLFKHIEHKSLGL